MQCARHSEKNEQGTRFHVLFVEKEDFEKVSKGNVCRRKNAANEFIRIDDNMRRLHQKKDRFLNGNDKLTDTRDKQTKLSARAAVVLNN